MSQFATRLQRQIQLHSPLCVGIDPSAALLYSCGLPDTAEGALNFGRRVLYAADFQLSIIKPQAAFFERFGAAGYQALEELVRVARAREVLVLLDGKRGDIETTGAAYGEGYFSNTTTMQVDAATTHAYLGFAALEPFIRIAAAGNGGVFVVVRSSNPEGEGLQTARYPDGRSVAQHLSAAITQRNRAFDVEALGPIGAVVGATCADAAAIIDELPLSFILAPGVGAQGATIADVKARMPNARGRVLPSVSRAILANGVTDCDIRTSIKALQAQARELL
jgi:orotidine-5'-phosphate decarboxylase